jgi:glutamine synthetase
MPDPATANIDPFFEETTLFLQCDVIEPGDGKAYDRDPRSVAKRAEAYLKASGLGDTVLHFSFKEGVALKHSLHLLLKY